MKLLQSNLMETIGRNQLSLCGNPVKGDMPENDGYDDRFAIASSIA